MPYYTGIANSASDLRNVIVTAATDNGWSWDPVYSMLYKSDIYGRLTVSGTDLYVQAALGYSGSTLNTPAPKMVGITDRIRRTGNTLLSYPLTYHIFVHTSPDDIIVAANYQVVWWQWLGIGKAQSFGALGNSVWHWGTAASDIDTSSGCMIYAHGGVYLYGGCVSGAPFWPVDNQGNKYRPSSSIYLNLDGRGWWNSNPIDSSGAGVAKSNISLPTLLQVQPNAWNGEAVLLQINVIAARPSGLYSHVAELTHLRMLRNDNITDGQIITIGTEQWFVAPVYRRNPDNRNGSADLNHSGTMAIAVRYDGP